MIKNKKAIALPFNWIFAMIVGAFVLFLALYVSGKIMDTGQIGINTITAKQFISLFDPFETGIASGKSEHIFFKVKSKVFFDKCTSDPDPEPFGRQTIAFSEEMNNGKYGENSSKVFINDKYIFAEKVVEGKEITVFSKPFSLPFKISDIIVVLSEDYCFYNAPSRVKRDLQGLNINNINFSDEITNCIGTIVCFDDSRRECDIVVIPDSINGYDSGEIIKRNKKEDKVDTIYFSGNLLYAGIFSSPEIYECNVNRIIKRFVELAQVYRDKIIIIQRKGCHSTLDSGLLGMINSAKQLRTSEDLSRLGLILNAKDIDDSNKKVKLACRLYQKTL